MEWWIYSLIALVTVSLAFLGNYYLQRKLITINNKEKGIDFLIDTIKELENLYIKYWNKEIHCASTSIKIKITQNQSIEFINFLYKKYSLKDEKKMVILLLKNLIKNATDEDFDSSERDRSNLDKSIKIAKDTNNIIVELLKNKI